MAPAALQPGEPTTENAYIRCKVTTIVPRGIGYVAVVEVMDLQPVQAGDVIARITRRVGSCSPATASDHSLRAGTNATGNFT